MVPEWFITLGYITLSVFMVGFLGSIVALIGAFAWAVWKEERRKRNHDGR